jgi:predicted nucleic acid-binding protein
LIIYLDTSVLLRFLLNQPDILPGFGTWHTGCTSEISGVEMRRTIDRCRLNGELQDKDVANCQQEILRIEGSLDQIVIEQAVLRQASAAMPTVVRTLDAIHLASAMLFREHKAPELRFATHDSQQALAATALGFEIVGTTPCQA